MLITPANFRLITDRLGAAWDLLAGAGSSVGAPVAGTARDFIHKAHLTIVNDVDDHEQQIDMATALLTASLGVSRERAASEFIQAAFASLDGHMRGRGRQVSTLIESVPSFLDYYNGGAGGAEFSNLTTPQFGDMYFEYKKARLTTKTVLSPAINPANGAASGMGTRAVGGAFVDGATPDLTKHAPVNLVAVVTADFAAGTAAPSLTVATVDDTLAALNFTGTFAVVNPAAAVATTLVGAATANARQSVTLTSAAGVAVGSWLTIEAGTPREESVLVEALAGAVITAVFKKAHNAASAVTGSHTLALTPATAGRRARDVTGITINITGHTGGAVRIEGAQDRVPI